jgi:hypothetical protein
MTEFEAAFRTAIETAYEATDDVGTYDETPMGVDIVAELEAAPAVKAAKPRKPSRKAAKVAQDVQPAANVVSLQRVRDETAEAIRTMDESAANASPLDEAEQAEIAREAPAPSVPAGWEYADTSTDGDGGEAEAVPEPFFAMLPVPFLQAALGCVSTEETRYYLNGIHLRAVDGNVRMCATDGHRLFVGSHPIPECDRDRVPGWLTAGVIVSREGLKPRLAIVKAETDKADTAYSPAQPRVPASSRSRKHRAR